MFAEWIDGFANGSQERYRGYKAWSLSLRSAQGELTCLALNNPGNNPGLSMLDVRMQSGNSEEGYCSRLEKSGRLHGEGHDRPAGPGRPEGLMESLTLRVGRT